MVNSCRLNHPILRTWSAKYFLPLPLMTFRYRSNILLASVTLSLMLYLAYRCNCSDSWPHRRNQSQQSFQETYGRTCKNHKSLPEGLFGKNFTPYIQSWPTPLQKSANASGIPSFHSPNLLFVTQLVSTVSSKSIKLYLSAVKFKAVELGFKDQFNKMSHSFTFYVEESSVS